MNKHQLANAIGISHSAVDFHVSRLEEYGLAETRSSTTDEREAICFTADNVKLWDDEGTRMLFGRGVPRRVAEYLAEHPGANAAQLSEALGLSLKTVRRHLRMLQKADLVQQIRIERDVLYHAEPELQDCMRRRGSPKEGRGEGGACQGTSEVEPR